MNKNNRKQNIGKNQSGFSLLEILVVMVMMATLIGLVANSVGNSKSKGDMKTAEIMIGKLKLKIEEFNLDMGYYPRSLDALVNENGDSNWMGPYVKEKELKDPWNEPFQYSSPGQHGEEFSIVSHGKDRSPGGEKFNKDINSWDL